MPGQRFLRSRHNLVAEKNRAKWKLRRLCAQYIAKEKRLPWSRSSKRPKDSKGPPVDDALLVERLRRRDEQAFMQLYDLYSGPVYRFLMHITGSMVLAEELTQEAFVAILDAAYTGSLSSFDSEKGTLEGYLLGIARNLARAERRRASRVVSLDILVETPEWERLLNAMFKETRGWDVAGTMAAQSELKALYRAVLELPGHYREAVALCGIQGKSYREAAMILECSEGTIASRMNRAKALLAAKLHRSLCGAGAWSETC
jgi:RNA polymerase sigma-70 factor, ECF subfamily